MFLLLFLGLAVTAFGLLSNCYVAGYFDGGFSFSWAHFDTFIISISLGAKKLLPHDDAMRAYLIEMWIGVGVVVIWSLLLYIIKYLERKYEMMIDN